MKRDWAIILVALAATVALSGCLEPYRARVPVEILNAADPRWEVVVEKLESDGWFGPRLQETRYSFVPAGNDPPFPGVLQVFSLREMNRRSNDALLDWTRDVVAEAAARENIALDPELDMDGSRTWRSEVHTTWFVREGTVTASGSLFSTDERVRILGEVGHDGRSNTSILVVAKVQVSRQPQCPLDLPCQNQPDEKTWIQVVGDPDGSVGGASLSAGFIHNLVTR